MDENKQSTVPVLHKRPVVLQYYEIQDLLQKHNSNCHGDLTSEMSFLYELVHKGQWDYVTQLLDPLRDYEGHTHSMYLVYRQEYIELLMSGNSFTKHTLDILLKKIKSVTTDKEEYKRLSLLNNYHSLSSHSDYSDWSIETSRGQLYRDLFKFLSRHMTLPHVTSLVVLVARGLYYQLCEQHIIKRCGLNSPIPNNHMIDLLSWLRQLPDTVYEYSFNALPISLTSEATPKTTPSSVQPPISKSQTTPTICKPIPVQLSCPVVSTPKTTPTILTTPPKLATTPDVVIRNDPPIVATPTIGATPTIQPPPTIQAMPINVTPPRTLSPLSSSTPREPISQLLPRNHPNITLPTPIPYKEVWPEVTLATTFTEKQVIRSVCFSTDGLVTIGANTRTLSILDPTSLLPPSRPTNRSSSLPLPSPSLKTLYSHQNYHRGSIYCMTWYGNSLLATGSNDQTINLLSHCNDKFTQIGDIKEFGGTVREMTFLPKVTTRHLLACGNGVSPIQLIDIERLHVSRDFKTINCPLLSIANIDENTCITGSEDGTIMLWDLRCPLFPTSLYSCPPHSITSLDHSSSIIACSTSSGDCMTISLHNKGLLNQWRPHVEECRSIRYSPDNHWILSSSFDGTICLTNTITYEWKVIGGRDNKVIQSRWHPSGNLIACASADKTASFWTIKYHN